MKCEMHWKTAIFRDVLHTISKNRHVKRHGRYVKRHDLWITLGELLIVYEINAAITHTTNINNVFLYHFLASFFYCLRPTFHS